MKTRDVEAFLLSCPLLEPLRLTYHGGERTILKRDALLVRVTAEGGRYGRAPGVADEATAAAIPDQVAPYLAGRAVVERYPYLPGPWSTFRLDSPPTVVAVVGDHSVTQVPAGRADGPGRRA